MMTRRHSWLPPALTFACGLVLTALVYGAVHEVEEGRQRAEFKEAANQRIALLREGLEATVDVLGTVTRLFTTMQPVSRAQFAAFTRPMLERHSQVEVIGWQALVPDAERAQFEAARRRELPGFAVRELVDGRLVPAARRPSYRVVDYLAPQEGHEGALGLDAGARPEQEAAMRRACRSGEAAMTGEFNLFFGNRQQPGFVIMMPVYRDGTVVAPGGNQCDRVAGYTTAIFSSHALVQRTLGAQPPGQRPVGSVRLYAAAGPDPRHLVYLKESPTAPRGALIFDGDRPQSVARTIKVAGQPLHLVVSPPAPALLRDHLGSLLTLAGGLLLSLGAAAFAGVLATRARRVHAMVDQRTAELTRASASLQLRQQAIEACVNSIIIASAEGPDYPVEYVNPAFERLNGYRAAEVIGQGCIRMLGKGLARSGVRDIMSMARERRGGDVLLRTERKDGTELWCEMYIAPCAGPDGEVRHFVVVQHDITEKRRYAGELEYQATHDALTGLANRKLLRRRLQEEIAAAGRAGQAVSVLFLDLDRFKFINDSLGHKAGNIFLSTIADRLSQAVRIGDMVARLGGDEFVLVLPERAGGPLSGAAIERIMGAVAEPVAIDGQEFEVGCSAGIANFPADGTDPDVLIDCADRAMYAAKQRGPHQFQYFLPEMHQQAHERLELERALGGALAAGQFQIVYQPWADLSSGRVAGVQARLRWQHPVLGLLPPERFLPVAEESGTGAVLGAWLLEQACRQVRAWRDGGCGDLALALGLGRRQMKETGLPGKVGQVLAETGLPPHCLRLELAESAVAGEDVQVLPVLNGLRALGVRLAIDRFGTGQVTLAELRRLPIDVLQIDRSLIRDLPGHRGAEAITDAIVSMAHSLGIRVLAGGVDTEAQCEFLSRNMCDEVEGELLAPPLTPEAAGALLAGNAGLPARLLRLHKRERTLLLVDDEPNILAALKRQMRGMGCRILTASGGQEGLAILEREAVDVIVSDQRMPGMTGVEFLRVVKQSHPDTVRMVLSGFTELQSVTDAVNEGAIYKFLTKPWDDTQLRAHIEEAFRNKEMVDENRRLGLELRTANHELAAANRQLEDVLEQQREQIRRDSISLDIVREALQRVPLPILALDEDRQVAYANVAARRLFGDSGTLLGSSAAEVMPGLLLDLEGLDGGASLSTEMGGRTYEVVAHNMGRGTRSRGTLLSFSPIRSGEQDE
ncbi:EAL domain-containing protein [Massilia sp. LjRoot122]|uniref:EAL domain-containing protein n=1 Tax=Massilia sp. LjRoot122 TaxID=3342257 RepID=UPI003ECE7B9B